MSEKLNLEFFFFCIFSHFSTIFLFGNFNFWTILWRFFLVSTVSLCGLFGDPAGQFLAPSAFCLMLQHLSGCPVQFVFPTNNTCMFLHSS